MKNFETGRGVKRSVNARERTQSHPVSNNPSHGKHAIKSNHENYGDLFILRKDLSLSNGLTNSSSLVSQFQKSGILYSESPIFCTSLHGSSSSTSELHTQISNGLFLPHPWRPECPMPQMLLQGEDLGYQPNEEQMHGNPVLLEDVMAGNFCNPIGISNSPATNTAEQVDWHAEIDQFDIMNNDENPIMDEIYGVPQDPRVSTMNMEQYQTGRNISLSTEEQFETNPFITGSDALNKPRIRWTQELHDHFVQAVNELGGADRATPKNIKIKMGLEWLTIYHVKSHLQKYRLAKHQPQAKEDKNSSCLEEKKKITTDKESGQPKMTIYDPEALRLQWELQKNLHGQLEFQKELQLRAEENARQLQELLEEQKRVGQAFMLASQCLPFAAGPSSVSSASAGLQIGTKGLSGKNEKLNEDTKEDSSSSDLHIEVLHPQREQGSIPGTPILILNMLQQ